MIWSILGALLSIAIPAFLIMFIEEFPILEAIVMSVFFIILIYGVLTEGNDK